VLGPFTWSTLVIFVLDLNTDDGATSFQNNPFVCRQFVRRNDEHSEDRLGHFGEWGILINQSGRPPLRTSP